MLKNIFQCTKCFPITNYRLPHKNTEQFLLGKNDNKINCVYLYFPIALISSHAQIAKAELVLYGLNNNRYRQQEPVCYKISPTSQYLSPNYPYFDEQVCWGFYSYFYLANQSQPVLNLDITELVKQWISIEITNYGCVIEIDNAQGVLEFMGGALAETAPFITIEYSLTGETIPAMLEASIPLYSTVKIK